MPGNRSRAFVYRSSVRGSLQNLFAVRGTPEHLRSDNLDNDTGPEFVSTVICRWLKEADVKTLFIAKGSPWENDYVESFNGTLRDELLNREIFLSFEEACWVIDRWRLDYKHHRIHSSLDYQPQFSHSTWCKDRGVVSLQFRTFHLILFFMPVPTKATQDPVNT